MLSFMILPAITLEKINQHALGKKKLVVSVLFWFFFFRFYLSLLYRTSLTCIGQKRHKNSLNNRPIKTITQHLIERTNHKIQCSKRTLVSLTERHTLVASWLTLNFSILMSPPPRSRSARQIQPCCTRRAHRSQ